jgi:Protein of unknown function (DUF1236)
MTCRAATIGIALMGLVGQAFAQPAAGAENESSNINPRMGATAPKAQPELTPEQKAVILDAVRPSGAKVKTPENVPVSIGAQVPPATELYFLPDKALATAPEAKGVKYTVAQNRVVLVDPTTMRVVDVIP